MGKKGVSVSAAAEEAEWRAESDLRTLDAATLAAIREGLYGG